MHTIQRGNTNILNLKATGALNKRYMDASVVQMSFTLTDKFDFAIGDSVEVHGQRFYLNKIPALTQQSSFKYDYVASFEARFYDLAKVIFCQYDENNELTEGSFSLMATANEFLSLIVKNANRDQSGWEVGIVDTTEAKNLTFSANTKCLTAFAQVAEAFGLEYWEENQVLHLTKKGASSGLTFAYGKGNGFYSIGRTNENDAAITTVVYARGGSKNIPNNYRNYSSRLKLPVLAGSRLTSNTNLYGFNEEWLENDEIYPRRTGTVTAINGHLKFRDADIDFDVNEQLMSGVSAKVTFQTGQLAGYELELSNFNPLTKEFTLKVNTDEKALKVPSELLHAAVGDKYILHDIVMPSSYILSAEQELYDWAFAYLQKNSIPRVTVQPTADLLHFRRQGISLSLGDTANIVAPKLGINKELRILGYTQDINDPYNYTSLEFAETALPRAANSIAARAEKIDNAIRINNLLNPAKARNNWRTTQELTTMLDTLRAEMLLITVAGAAYDTNIAASVNADSFATTVGTIQHAEYIDNGGSWNVSSSTNELENDASYYVYFKASKVNNTATVVLSSTKVGVEDVDGFYHFPYGIISSIIDSTRVFTSTKGYTRIVGDNVSTGKISATNGSTVLDLDNGVFDIAGNAGISGNGSLPTSVRFWAGSNFDNRATAPFRVDHAGRLFATNATISGHIEATSGSIAGVQIDATDLFSLDGSKVKIFPENGIRVFNGGYLSLSKTPPNVADMPIDEWCIYVKEDVSPTLPTHIIANLGDLLDVDASGRANDYVLYWDAASGKYKFKAASFGPGSDVYSKTEINNFFSGVTGITGYNKGNWDSAYGWGNHALAGYAMANGSNASGTWAINISGKAQNSTLYADYGFEDVLVSDFSMAMVRRTDGQVWTNITKAQLKVAFGFTGNEILTGINDTPRDIGIAKMLRWKNYGDGHVIFDASNGTAPNGTAIDRKNSQQPWAESFPTLMGWNGTNTYGVRVESSRVADIWGGREANLATVVNETQFGGIAVVANDGLVKYTDKTALKSWIGLPLDGSGYDLTGVTARGSSTPFSIYMNSNAALLFRRGTTGEVMYVGTQEGATGANTGNGVVWIYGVDKSFNVYTNGTARGVFYDNGFYSTGFNDAAPSAAFRLYNGSNFTGGFGSGSWSGSHSADTAVLFAPSGKQLGFGAEGANVGTWTASALSINTSFSSSSYIIGHRVIAGTYDSGAAGSVNTTDHLRVSGNGGVYWATHLLGLVANSENPLLYNNNSSIWLRLATAGGNVIGGIYAESGGSLGFLNASGSWTFQVQGNGNAYVYGALTVSSALIAGGTGANIAFNTSLTNRAGIFQDATGNNVVYIANWFDSTKGLSIDPVTGLVTATTFSSNKITGSTVRVTDMLVVPKVEPAVADMPVDEWCMYIKEL